MTLNTDFELANNAEFRLLANFSTPPRAGRITALESNGQVRVATDDPDGGDVLAWPLNGFQYAVNDVVYLAFALNNPDSAIVIGAKAPLPKLNAAVLPKPYVPVDGTAPLTADWDIGEDRRIHAEALRARDNEGMRLENAAGNLGVGINNNGNVGIGTDNAITLFEVYGLTGGLTLTRTQASDSLPPFIVFRHGTTPANVAQIRAIAAGGLGIHDGSSAVRFVHWDANGNQGMGVDTAQGRLHIHDGVGGLIFVTKSNVINAAQVIIPNATGDVTGAITGFFVVTTSGGATVANAFSMWPGDNFDITAGGYTMRLTLNANGQLTAIRQSGSGSATLAIAAIWT